MDAALMTFPGLVGIKSPQLAVETIAPRQRQRTPQQALERITEDRRRRTPCWIGAVWTGDSARQRQGADHTGRGTVSRHHFSVAGAVQAPISSRRVSSAPQVGPASKGTGPMKSSRTSAAGGVSRRSRWRRRVAHRPGPFSTSSDTEPRNKLSDLSNAARLRQQDAAPGGRRGRGENGLNQAGFQQVVDTDVEHLCSTTSRWRGPGRPQARARERARPGRSGVSILKVDDRAHRPARAEHLFELSLRC